MNGIADWIMVAIGVVGLILTITAPLFVGLYRTHQSTAKELSEHKTHVAETYATKDDVKELGDRMERSMANGFEQIKELINNRNAA